jgi:hypothetical protein
MFEISQIELQHQIAVAILKKLDSGFDCVLLEPHGERYSYRAWAPIRAKNNGSQRSCHGVTRRLRA